MEALVTLKVSPREFDMIRESIQALQQLQSAAANDLDLPVPDRKEAREYRAALDRFMEKLQ